MDHYSQAKAILKAEMVRNGISTAELAARLQTLGTPEAVGSLKTKISRGRFQVAFLLHCLAAMGVRELHISVPSAQDVIAAGFDQYNRRPGPTAKKEARERAAQMRKAGKIIEPRSTTRSKKEVPTSETA
ncbi:DUF6471 domain-containing protein [Paraburkholderia flagellata]|uniref:DUF6471 domain-containing protein n=1 Tax=Paraburkholderia flagellata TaxID=2883241 RepID=UPI001F459976|nr:DUF6471 domain-containing protein [Paraburkholderia flagellata]